MAQYWAQFNTLGRSRAHSFLIARVFTQPGSLAEVPILSQSPNSNPMKSTSYRIVIYTRLGHSDFLTG